MTETRAATARRVLGVSLPRIVQLVGDGVLRRGARYGHVDAASVAEELARRQIVADFEPARDKKSPELTLRRLRKRGVPSDDSPLSLTAESK